MSTLNDIKTRLDNFTSLLQTVVNTNIPSLTLPRDVNLPIDNNDDLEQLEANLLNPTLKDQLVSNVYDPFNLSCCSYIVLENEKLGKTVA